MTEPDPTDLKKRARRRLIGAATLALVAAIVLPAVMDDEPRLSGEDIEVTIPGRTDRATVAQAQRPAPGDEPPSSASSAPEVAQSDAADRPLLPPTVTTTPAADAGNVPESAEAARPASGPAADATAVARVESAPQESAAGDDPNVPSRTELEAARVLAMLTGKPPEALWLIQVAAFRQTENAERMSRTLTSEGFRAYTEARGEWVLVRVGPFPDQDIAADTARRLRAAGHSAVVKRRAVTP